ncbi:hypothetical protein U1Q18_021053 [Sarracenia purpurea var. burkii]
MGLRGLVSTRGNTLLWMQAAHVKERGRGAGSGALSCGDCGSLGSGGQVHTRRSGRAQTRRVRIGRETVPRGLSATETSPTSYSVH